MLRIGVGRRTQVVKGEVCKTSMQRFESARRLHFLLDFVETPNPLLHKEMFGFCSNFGGKSR
jgi:hypothetical protein